MKIATILAALLVAVLAVASGEIAKAHARIVGRPAARVQPLDSTAQWPDGALRAWTSEAKSASEQFSNSAPKTISMVEHRMIGWYFSEAEVRADGPNGTIRTRIIVEDAGWPFLATRSIDWMVSDEQTQTMVAMSTSLSGAPRIVVDPIRPVLYCDQILWPGMVANVGAGVVAVILIYVVGRAVIRGLKRMSSRCPSCSYDVRGQSQCPECGYVLGTIASTAPEPPASTAS